MIFLRGVPRLEVPIWWRQAWPLLELAVRRWKERYREPDIFAKLIAADAQLWLATEEGRAIAAALTEVVGYPRKRALNILAVGGGGQGLWSAWMEKIEEWALEIDCDFIEIRGRDGWLRILEPNGFKKDCVVLVKELKNERRRWQHDIGDQDRAS